MSDTKLSNLEIAVFALYELGGLSKVVGTEDIALKCYQLAPDAFSWINHPQYPDKDVARNALFDAQRERYGCLIKGRAGRGKRYSNDEDSVPEIDGWILTERGAIWISENLDRIVKGLDIRPPSYRQRERQALLQHLQKDGGPGPYGESGIRCLGFSCHRQQHQRML